MTMTPRDPDGDDHHHDEHDDAGGGGVAGFDFGDLLAQAQSLQERIVDAQAAVAEMVVEGQAGGGVVKVRTTGALDFQAVVIDPSAVDPTDVEMLEDLVLAAVRDAVAQANELNQEAIGGFGGALGGMLP